MHNLKQSSSTSRKESGTHSHNFSNELLESVRSGHTNPINMIESLQNELMQIKKQNNELKLQFDKDRKIYRKQLYRSN